MTEPSQTDSDGRDRQTYEGPNCGSTRPHDPHFHSPIGGLTLNCPGAASASSGRPESLADYLPTEAEQFTYALQEHRDAVAAEIRRHLSNIESEIRRHREALAHYDSVFDLRLTGSTRENPSGTASAEGTSA